MNDSLIRVLVIDDDQEDFLILRDLLADFPLGRYRLDWVGTLAEGVEALRASSHDVYLVDYLLGPDNGLDLVRLAVAERSAHRPVILLTGHGNAEVDREAMAAGAADYLVKDRIDGETLARAIRYAAERARHLGEVEEAQRRFRLLFERSPIPSWVFEIDSGRFVAVNDAMVASYGYSREELLRMSITDIRSESEADRLRTYQRTSGDVEGFAGVWQHLRRDGTPLWVEITSHNLVLDGRACRQVIANDITARRAAQSQLQLLERAVQASTSGVVISDAQAPDLPIIYVNDAFEQITGYTRADALGRNCRFLQGEFDGQPELDLVRHALRFDKTCDVILRNQRKDGRMFWNHVIISPVRDDRGVVTHFVGVQNDLTERRRVEAELAHAASHDPVTHLPRYPVLEADAARRLAHDAAGLAMLYIDIDRFHGVNETMGHAVGDEVLRVLGERLREALGDTDEVSRFAGDEFVAIVSTTEDPEALRSLAQRLRAAVARPIEGDGFRLTLTASIGLSRAPEHGRAPTELLRNAEAAMTRAKREGRDSVCEFTTEQMREVEDRLVLGARLREAPRRGELELHYQPLVCAGSARLVGYEALLRWSSAELGKVSPARFIPIAESLGLMVEIGHWVIEEACRQLRAWREAGHAGFTVSVNFSAQELQRPDVVQMVRAAIERHGIEPGRLEIEITESSLMEHVGRVVQVMGELKGLGVRLSLDDFGTGYSSLAYLKQFSIDKLKIDRSFVKDLPLDADAAAIASTIIGIGHQLRMKVVAEGVETEAQAAFLRQMGCDELQGYLYSPPLPAARAIALREATAVPIAD
jgi:diguanylate cyclase (GGDEF)-like protein/PAS domain S-box-containing protein